MSSRYELEVTLTSAKDLRNVNWRHAPVQTYPVAWVDPSYNWYTKVDRKGDTCPYWDETLTISMSPDTRPEECTPYVDIVHAGSEEGTKPLVGSAKLKGLQLKRPSGPPHGKVDVMVCVRSPRYHPLGAYGATPYGIASRDFAPTQPYRYPTNGSQAPPPVQPYCDGPPPAGYPYLAGGYGQPQPVYGQSGYGQPPVIEGENKNSKFVGMGTGLAAGAAVGAMGGLALAEGFDALEDHSGRCGK